MRVIIQRVLSASVTVEDRLVSEIGRGLLILVGITPGKSTLWCNMNSSGPLLAGDSAKQVNALTSKISKLRLWPNDDGKEWQINVCDKAYDILCVSQFTLYAVTSKGTKPDFHQAAKSDVAQGLYNDFLKTLRQKVEKSGIAVRDGEFGANMKVALVNDGPVTISIENAPEPEDK